LLGGLYGAMTKGDASQLLSGIQRAVTDVLASPTLTEDIPTFLKKSEAKDDMGGTWSQGSGVPDLSDDERQKGIDKYNSQQFPDYEGMVKDWFADDAARQGAQEQKQMDGISKITPMQIRAFKAFRFSSLIASQLSS
jgi:hypothetical protein